MWVVWQGWGVFLSTFEKQLDAKRRIVVPQEFRAAVSGAFDGVADGETRARLVSLLRLARI